MKWVADNRIICSSSSSHLSEEECLLEVKEVNRCHTIKDENGDTY